MGRELTLHHVAGMFNVPLPQPGRRGKCIFRSHKRNQQHLSVFRVSDGQMLFKCHACDPPDNVGDAVSLYAILSGQDRRSAWKELREKGYAVPGARDDFSPRSGRRRAVVKPKPMPVTGRKPERILELNAERWKSIEQKRLGAVELFAKKRLLPPADLRQLDVVDMDGRTIGFGYRRPFTSEPCRIKVRPLDRKTFWIEPRPPKNQDPGSVAAKADNPLYLAHCLGGGEQAVITEGETDALTLATMNVPNVVSLPDGASSGKHVDLEPVSMRYRLWLVATDFDDDGRRAYNELAARGSRLGIATAWVRWKKDGRTHKDANDALCAGFVRDDFVRCLEDAAASAFGYRVKIA